MSQLKDALIAAAKPAIARIVEVQQDFIAGRAEAEIKEDKSVVTRGDKESQDIYTRILNEKLGEDNIYYVREEAVSGAEAAANEVRKQTAKYRVIIDPIDGTGNYASGKNRATSELTAADLATDKVKPGYGSMVTIQERQPNGDFKSVISAIYETSSQDKVGSLKGKMYVAEEGVQGLTAIDMATGVESAFVRDKSKPIVVQGGFTKEPNSDKAQKDLQTMAKGEGNHLIDFSCVAQSALSVITGQSAGYFQEHPNLHDVAAIGHLADAAGVSVVVLDQNNSPDNPYSKGNEKPAVFVAKDGKQRFPVFMAESPELAEKMARTYLAAKGLDESKVTFRDGQWNEGSLDKLIAEQKQRAGSGVSGAGSLTQEPERKAHLG